LSKTFLASGDGKLVFTDLLGLPYWIGALTLAVVLVAILVSLEAWLPWREELGPNVDGDRPDAGARRAPPAHAVPAE
jgi:hypothetical protein